MSAEKKFRKNLVKFLKAYQKEKNIKGPVSEKIIDGISSKKLHDMAEDFLKTKKKYETMEGGKRSRRHRRRRKKKTRKNQRGGQWELFNGTVVFMVGAVVAALVYREYSRMIERLEEEDLPEINDVDWDNFLNARPGSSAKIW